MRFEPVLWLLTVSTYSKAGILRIIANGSDTNTVITRYICHGYLGMTY